MNSGRLNLDGQLTGVSDLAIADGATLLSGSADRVADSALVNLENGGTWTLGGDDLIGSLSSSGLLNGGGVLTATGYDLSNGAVTSNGANLGTGELNSGPGSVILNGNTNADSINVHGGSLTTNGAVQNSAGVISVASGATWLVNGSYSYDSLQGFGTVNPGGVNGMTFTNSTNLRPGTSIGSLSIVGNYVEAGTFHGELDPTDVGSPYLLSDNITVSGSTTLTGSSVLNVTGINGLSPGGVGIGHRFDLFSSAGGIIGGWGEITDGNNTGPGGVTFDSQFLFNAATGDLLGLGLTGTQTPADYAGINTNQIITLNSITDGATDAVGNYRSDDGAEGTVLDAIYSTGAPGDVSARLGAVDAISPEGYAGALDYTLHATRNYTRSVKSAAPLVTGKNYEVVAGLNSFGTGSSSSGNSNDYDLRSTGGYIGLRARGNSEFSFGGFVAFDDGEVDAGRVDLDTSGFILGGFVEFTPTHAESITYWGNMSYGSYEFDGSRNGLVSKLSVPGFDGSAFQVGLGVDYLAYAKGGLQFVPGASLNFMTSSVDGFAETGGADALIVNDQDISATYLDIALRLQYQVPNQPISLHGELGWQHNFGDADRDVSATLGSSAFEVNAPGMGDDAVFIGLGINYDFNDRYQIGLSYRGEFRGDAEAFNGVNLNVKARF